MRNYTPEREPEVALASWDLRFLRRCVQPGARHAAFPAFLSSERARVRDRVSIAAPASPGRLTHQLYRRALAQANFWL